MTAELEEPVTVPQQIQTEDDRLAHLVLMEDWPIALCGATVKDRLGTGAAGRDRCYECIRIAQQRQLGRPGWA
jgi:hypothetical protein